jgi:enoyl-CoA hydratase/carnithine racemase
MSAPELLRFTRMTGDLVKAMRKRAPQPVMAAVDGICAGAGAMIALAADLRLATPDARTAFLFTRVGLAGADMGACGLLPRVIGQGRATELLMSGRAMSADEGLAWGFFNALHPARTTCCRRPRRWRGPRRRAVVCAHGDQDHAEPGMEHGHRGDDRERSPGAGAVHDDAGLPRAFEAFAARQKPASRATEVAGN